jgi:hypothetical protein
VRELVHERRDPRVGLQPRRQPDRLGLAVTATVGGFEAGWELADLDPVAVPAGEALVAVEQTDVAVAGDRRDRRRGQVRGSAGGGSGSTSDTSNTLTSR